MGSLKIRMATKAFRDNRRNAILTRSSRKFAHVPVIAFFGLCITTGFALAWFFAR